LSMECVNCKRLELNARFCCWNIALKHQSSWYVFISVVQTPFCLLHCAFCCIFVCRSLWVNIQKHIIKLYLGYNSIGYEPKTIIEHIENKTRKS
jgi:hypothetical protein